MEFGISMFGDLALDPKTQIRKDPAERMAEILEEIKLADEVGLDIFGMGEHHRADYLVSEPEMLLAAASSITKNIKLGSAVTVLSSADPVRVYESFSMLDLISKGRAELMVGRGSFIESFPLFGFNLADYEKLFEEKLDLLLALNKGGKINWRGTLRAPLIDQEVFPKPVKGSLPIWIAAGGTPESVLRAAKLGLPLTIAIIGGMPKQFVPLVDMYRAQWEAFGHKKEAYQFSVNSHLFVGEDSSIRDWHYPVYARQMDQVGKDRGWPPFRKEVYDATAGPGGAYLFGSPNEVIDKLLYNHELFQYTRFVGQIDVGGPDHLKMMRSIELFGTKVVPEVKKALGV